MATAKPSFGQLWGSASDPGTIYPKFVWGGKECEGVRATDLRDALRGELRKRNRFLKTAFDTERAGRGAGLLAWDMYFDPSSNIYFYVQSDCARP